MERKRTTQVWRLIEQYMDGQVVPVKQAGIAHAVGVGRSSLSQWKYGQTTPTPANLRKLHEVTRIPYRTFLDALLVDMGYLDAEEGDGSGNTAANIHAGNAREPERTVPQQPTSRAGVARTAKGKAAAQEPKVTRSHQA